MLDLITLEVAETHAYGTITMNISTAYPRTLGVILAHDFCWESPPTCLESNA